MVCITPKSRNRKTGNYGWTSVFLRAFVLTVGAASARYCETQWEAPFQLSFCLKFSQIIVRYENLQKRYPVKAGSCFKKCHLPLWESRVHPGYSPCESDSAANPTAPASQGGSCTGLRKGQLMLKTIMSALCAFKGLDCPHNCNFQHTSCISNEVISHYLVTYH